MGNTLENRSWWKKHQKLVSWWKSFSSPFLCIQKENSVLILYHVHNLLEISTSLISCNFWTLKSCVSITNSRLVALGGFPLIFYGSSTSLSSSFFPWPFRLLPLPPFLHFLILANLTSFPSQNLACCKAQLLAYKTPLLPQTGWYMRAHVLGHE